MAKIELKNGRNEVIAIIEDNEAVKKANILGSEYEIYEECNAKDFPQLNDCYGFNDETIKRIVIGKLEPLSQNDLSNLKEFEKKVLRHEIIHAFLNESGLAECSEWARSEEMVDYFARQIPKMIEVFKNIKAL